MCGDAVPVVHRYPELMMHVPLLQGSCFCKAVSYTVSAPPIMSAYCHCTSCQRLTSCPFVHTIHFDATAFTWTHQEPHESQLDSYDNFLKPYKRRYRCKSCGVGVASFNSQTSCVSIWGASLNRNEEGKIVGWDIAKPTAHQFYGTRMLDVNDDLSKWEGYELKSEKLD